MAGRALSFPYWPFPPQGVRLPPKLAHLIFGDDFDQNLENIKWPQQLQSLTFGAEYNQSLRGVRLPDDLQSLTFGDLFNQNLAAWPKAQSLSSPKKLFDAEKVF